MSTSHSDFVLQLQGFIAGIDKHYVGATLQLDAQSVTAASLVTLFQAVLDTSAAVTAADTARTAAVARLAAAIAAAQPMAKALKSMVLAASGSDTATLADFKLTPHKAPVISPATRAAAAVKAAATRKALGTKGTAQKKAAKKALAAQPLPAATPAPATPEPAAAAPTTAVPPATKS